MIVNGLLWKRTEIILSVSEIASKYCISDSFVDYDVYSISSNGFLPTEFCQEYTLIIANTLFQQHERRLYMWISPDGQHQNQIGYILCSQRWRSYIQSAKTRLGAACSSDHEHFIAKFRLKLKKVGKITRLVRYDLNQIPYNYTVEVRNRFKGLDLIECLMNYGWRLVTLYRGDRDQDHPQEKEMQKSKMAV